MNDISLDYIQINKDKLNITCQYKLWIYSIKFDKSIKSLIHAESYKAMNNTVDKIKNSEKNDIINKMKDRCNSKLLFSALKNNRIEYFVPLQQLSYEITQEKDNIIIEICYYHSTDVYNIMYNNSWYHKKGYIMAPRGIVRENMISLYQSYRLDPPFQI